MSQPGGRGRPLEADFVPGPFDVICGRGKSCYQHSGNVNLTKLIIQHTDVYLNASSKDAKSAIVNTIIAEIKRLSPNGGFVKKEDQVWYVVGPFFAREKISQVFRNVLHDHYKSSTEMRRVVRQAKRHCVRAQMEESSSTSSSSPTTMTTTTTATGVTKAVTLSADSGAELLDGRLKNAPPPSTGGTSPVLHAAVARSPMTVDRTAKTTATPIASKYATLAPKPESTVPCARPNAYPLYSTVSASSCACAIDPISIDAVFGRVLTPNGAGQNVFTGNQRRHVDVPLSANAQTSGATTATTTTTTTTTDPFGGLMMLHEAAKILQPLNPAPASSFRKNGACVADDNHHHQYHDQQRHNVYPIMTVDPLPFERVFFLPPMDRREK